MLETIRVKKNIMAEAALGGFTNATDLADYLVRRGVAFREAHEAAGRAVLYCLEKGLTLDRISVMEFKKFNPLVEEDVYKAIDIKQCVEARKVPGGPASEKVAEAIARARQRLAGDIA
jgi:argininosuccinate lyase